jgi:hypothetical protein
VMTGGSVSYHASPTFWFSISGCFLTHPYQHQSADEIQNKCAARQTAASMHHLVSFYINTTHQKRFSLGCHAFGPGDLSITLLRAACCRPDPHWSPTGAQLSPVQSTTAALGLYAWLAN